MCDVNGPFKFCTCDTSVDRNKPHWILHRFIKSRLEYHLVGEFNYPDPYQKISIRSLKRRLNSVNLFDFEYEPQDGDYLELFMVSDFDEKSISPDYELEFTKGKWRLLEYFESFEFKHGKKQSGEIIGPKTDLTMAFENFKENASEKQLEKFDFYRMHPFIPKILNTKKGLMEFLKNSTK